MKIKNVEKTDYMAIFNFEKLAIQELLAGTSKDNFASQRVLEKNQFILIGEEKNVLKINGDLIMVSEHNMVYPFMVL